MARGVITGGKGEWNYEAPQDRAGKCLLLTIGATAIVGIWGDGEGLIAWMPLPKRNKKLEEELGLSGRFSGCSERLSRKSSKRKRTIDSQRGSKDTDR